jgi:hypothetical protein
MNFHPARLATEKAVFRPALPTCFRPGITEMQMAKLTYTEQLKHPKWQRKRLEMLEASGFKCTNCGTEEKTLHVHHKQYVRGRSAWEYSATELQVLCEDCHTTTHDIKERLVAFLALNFHDIPMEEFTYGLLGGFLSPFQLVSAEDMSEAWRLAQPSFDLGYLLAALGPEDMKDAVRRKIEAGKIPADHPVLKLILED